MREEWGKFVPGFVQVDQRRRVERMEREAEGVLEAHGR